MHTLAVFFAMLTNSKLEMSYLPQNNDILQFRITPGIFDVLLPLALVEKDFFQEKMTIKRTFFFNAFSIISCTLAVQLCFETLLLKFNNPY